MELVQSDSFYDVRYSNLMNDSIHIGFKKIDELLGKDTPLTTETLETFYDPT